MDQIRSGNYKPLVDQVRNLLAKKSLHNSTDVADSFDVSNEAYIRKCLDYARNRIHTIGDVFEKDLACLWSLPDRKCSFLKEKYGEVQGEKGLDAVIGIMREVRRSLETDFDDASATGRSIQSCVCFFEFFSLDTYLVNF